MDIHDLFQEFFGLGQDDGLDKETIEFKKGNVKTTIEAYFNKQGVLVKLNAGGEYLPSPEEEKKNRLQLLEKELNRALRKEDYLKAAELKKEKESLLQAK